MSEDDSVVVLWPPEMESNGRQSGKLCFSVFQVDLRTGELTKRGIRIRLQGQPFKVLSLLLERPGELITREELRQKLWGDDTVVDFDHGLATTINKIRERLGDSAENPRFVETIARRGYRFLAPVRYVPDVETSAAVETSTATVTATAPISTESLPKNTKLADRSSRLFFLVPLLVLLFFGVLFFYRYLNPPTPPRMRQITWSGHVFPGDLGMESFPGLATDGTRIYFNEIRDGRFVLAYSLLADNETHPLGINSEIAGPSLVGISSDGARLLVRNHLSPDVEQPLWIIPTVGNSAMRVPDVLAHDAAWMPDGQGILYASGLDLFITRSDGQKAQHFASLSGRAFWLRWSPNGKLLRFTLLDPRTRTASLWEIARDGRNLHPLFPESNELRGACCGSWTGDGRYYIFQASSEGRENIWALPESGLRRWFAYRPFQITNGPLGTFAPLVARGSNHLFFVGGHSQSQLFRYDLASHQLLRYLPELTTATHASFSPDGKKVAWISTNGGMLWSSRLDGSQRIQLTPRPMQIYMMAWAPDGKRLAFMGKESGKPWKIYTVSDTNTNPTMLLSEENSEADPTWSPDGRYIAFGRLTAYMAEDSKDKEIYIVDTANGSVSQLPGSKGLFSPRWSPDGHYLAAITLDQRKLMICDLATHKWIELPTASIDNPAWSSDSRFIYYHSFMEEGLPIYRLNVQSRQQERVFEFRDEQVSNAADYSFQGLAPDGSPLLSVHQWSADVYEMDWMAD